MEELPPIVVSMNVHCGACAKIIRRSLIRAFDVYKVSASPRMDMVVLHGGARLDPWAIKHFLQRLGEARHPSHGGGGAFMGRRRVTVVSDGGRQQRSHFEGIVHLAPMPPYAPYAFFPPPPPPANYGAGQRWF